jgi:HEAT repeat protein
MKSRLYLVCGALLAAAAVGLLWWSPWVPQEPVYAGPVGPPLYLRTESHPLSFWLTNSSSLLPSGLPGDSNAVPFLIKALQRERSLGAAFYRKWLWPKLPPPIQRHLPPPADNWVARNNAARLLGITALTRTLTHDDNPKVRVGAALALGNVGKGAAAAVAALTEALKDRDLSVRLFATNALLKIDPEAAIKAGVPEMEQVGKISGIVRDPSGAPSPGVRVAFYPGQYFKVPEPVEAITGNNGRYELNLQRHKRGTDDEPWIGSAMGDCLLARDLERNLCAIRVFSLKAGNTDLSLQPALSMSGTVKDASGAPMTNAVVQLRFMADHTRPELEGQPIRVNAEGAFSIPALPQGREYDFTVSAEGYGTPRRRLRAEMVKTNRYDFPTFVLRKADRTLAGRVVDLGGKPVPNAGVHLGAPGQPDFAPVQTDAKGRFEFKGVCEGPAAIVVGMLGPGNELLVNKTFVGLEAGDTNVLLSVDLAGRDWNTTTTGEQAIPSLLRWATNADEEVRYRAVYALGDLHAEPNRVVPVLIDALHDPSANVQFRAAGALGQFGPEARLAVPALVEFLSTAHYNFTKELVTNSLLKLDPEAAAKAGVKMPSP